MDDSGRGRRSFISHPLVIASMVLAATLMIAYVVVGVVADVPVGPKTVDGELERRFFPGQLVVIVIGIAIVGLGSLGAAVLDAKRPRDVDESASHAPSTEARTEASSRGAANRLRSSRASRLRRP